jgi:RNA polymerase sigma-70 factor, ECF subfamily
MLSDAAIQAFWARLGQPRPMGDAALELTALVDAARAAWPALELDSQRFCEYLGERAGAIEALASLKGADLYLACGCVDGNPIAMTAFDALVNAVADKLRRLAPNEDVLADAKQQVRQLMLPRAERSSEIGKYTGRGALAGWLRIVLGRELVRLAKRERRQPQLDTGEAALLVDGADDPEIAYLKAHYQHEFKQAFAAAMGELEADDRRALRYAVVEGLSIDEIAKLEGVHRATAARDVARARGRLADKTRSTLQTRLRLEAPQLASILRLVDSQIDVSVRRLLAG